VCVGERECGRASVCGCQTEMLRILELPLPQDLVAMASNAATGPDMHTQGVALKRALDNDDRVVSTSQPSSRQRVEHPETMSVETGSGGLMAPEKAPGVSVSERVARVCGWRVDGCVRVGGQAHEHRGVRVREALRLGMANLPDAPLVPDADAAGNAATGPAVSTRSAKAASSGVVPPPLPGSPPPAVATRSAETSGGVLPPVAARAVLMTQAEEYLYVKGCQM
jgi:hypothetical protein